MRWRPALCGAVRCGLGCSTPTAPLLIQELVVHYLLGLPLVLTVKSQPKHRPRRPSTCPTLNRYTTVSWRNGTRAALRRKPHAHKKIRRTASSAPLGGRSMKTKYSYCAVATAMLPAACSFKRTSATMRLNAGRAAALNGTELLCCAMVNGSWCSPLTRNSKCRCGPVL
jgi:hypothetical protein